MAARRLHQRIDRPNFLVAIPATPRGLPLIRAMISAGRSVNITSIVSIDRYSTVIDAYLSAWRRSLVVAEILQRFTASRRSLLSAMVDEEVETDGSSELGDSRHSSSRGLSALAQAQLGGLPTVRRNGSASDRMGATRPRRRHPSAAAVVASSSRQARRPGGSVATSKRCVSPNSVQALSESTVDACWRPHGDRARRGRSCAPPASCRISPPSASIWAMSVPCRACTTASSGMTCVRALSRFRHGATPMKVLPGPWLSVIPA